MKLKSICKWFSAAKGFGFIVNPVEEEKDIFVHYSAINADGFRVLKEGEEVEFDLVPSERGPQAANVTRVP